MAQGLQPNVLTHELASGIDRLAVEFDVTALLNLPHLVLIRVDAFEASGIKEMAEAVEGTRRVVERS